MKNRKLQEYQQFDIEIKNEYGGFFPVFNDTNGVRLPDWKTKLTPSQWKKASQYLTRELIPFSGYSYSVKPEYMKVGVYKIR